MPTSYGIDRIQQLLPHRYPFLLVDRVLEAAEVCGLEDVLDVRTGILSPGRRKCVAVAEALLLRPRFLVMDDARAY